MIEGLAGKSNREGAGWTLIIRAQRNWLDLRLGEL